ncbi:hypothetical protein ABZ926_14435 [Streptomyces litmocidini]|uniref:hypothetical protein n=1 Tax=Streptomyces litmocidini TaxID=67318 RepID=UPI00340AD2B5
MTDTFAQRSRTGRIRRLLTTLLFTAALITAVAAANNTDAPEAWWPRTGDAFTPPTGPHSVLDTPVPGMAGPDFAACGVGLDRASCTHPSPDSVPDKAGLAAGAPVTPGVWKTALLLLPVAAGLMVIGRTRSRKATSR